MKKNKLLLLIAMSTVCSLCVFAGCKEAQTATNTNEPQSKLEKEETAIFELNKTALANMVIGDESLLYAGFTAVSGQSVQWESSNSQVATVEKVNENIAKIVAVTAGEAVITAKYGENTQTCSVSVTQNGIYPALYLNNGVTDGAVVEKGEKFDLSTYVLFNGKQFEDMEVRYTLGDESYGTIDEENQTFIAGDKVGSTTITLEANWRNIQSELLKKTFNIKIVSSTVVSLNNGEFSQIDLYTVASLQGNTYKNEQAITSIKVEEDGQAVTDYTISVTNNQPADGTDRAVAIWDGTKLIANAYGKADFTISVGEEYSISYPISVSRPLVTYAEPIQWFSYLDGELPTSEIFADAEGEMQIIHAYQEGRALNVQEGKVFGVSSKSMDSMTLETVEVYNDKVGYILELETYAQVIDEPKDMHFMYDGTLVGYVYLKNNIVVEESIPYAGTSACFAGVFEGNGYKITMAMKPRGLFGGQLTGTLRNVWLEITNFRNLGNYGTNSLIATIATEGATIENVYVTVDPTTANPTRMQSIGLFEAVGKKTTIRNLVADFGDLLPATGYSYGMHGLLCQYLGSYVQDCVYENVYIISSGLKHLVYTQSSKDPTAGSMYYANNDEAFMEAEAELEANANRTQYVFTTINRYDTVEALIEAQNDLTTFDSAYWDISAGHPTWRNVKSTVNGEESNTVCLFNTADASENTATLGVEVMGEAVDFTLSVESGDASVITINGNKVTAKAGAIGSAVLLASYQIGEDELKIRFRVDVLPTFSQDVMYWGSELQQAYLPDGLLEAGETVASITDFETYTELYSVLNGYNFAVLKNTDNEIKSFRAIVRGTRGTVVTLNIYSYTRVIKTASDLDFLVPETEVKGSYILANNITVESWASAISNRDALSKTWFKGVFDGNGYTLTCPQKAYGIFGNIDATATVKNMKLVVTLNGEYKASANTGVILGFWMNGRLENMYVQLSGKVPNGCGMALYSATRTEATSAILKNVVIDYGDSYAGYEVSTNGAYGALALGNTTTICKNVYVINSLTALSGLSKGYTGTEVRYTYAENDATGADGETVVSGVRRYDDIADIVADTSSDKNLSSFDATFWDVTSGAPSWKNK